MDSVDEDMLDFDDIKPDGVRYFDDRPDDGSCEECGGPVEPIEHPYRDKWLSPRDRCEGCRRRGEVERRRETRRKERAKDAWDAAGIPPLKRKVLKHGDVELHGTVAQLLDHPPGEEPESPAWAVYLHGPQGSGKTVQAAKLIRDYICRWILTEGADATVRYTRSDDYLSALKASIGDDEESYDRVERSYRQADLLAVDDLGTENETSHSAEAMLRLIDYRCDHMLPTLWVSNFDLFDLSDESALYEPRAAGRIYEMCGGTYDEFQEVELTENQRFADQDVLG